MEIVLAHLYPDVYRHDHRHGGRRHVYRTWCIGDDSACRTMGGTFHIPGSRRIFGSDTVSWAVPNVVATQPEIYRDVFCSCDGLARHVHFYNVFLFSRALLTRLSTQQRNPREYRLHLPFRHGSDIFPLWPQTLESEAVEVDTQKRYLLPMGLCLFRLLVSPFLH